MTRLMISVRSVSDAVVALENGADWVDIKDPRNGPLGMAAPETIRAVVREVPAQLPVALSLGEWREWRLRSGEVPAIPQGVSYVKVGLSGMAAESVPGSWVDGFRQWRHAVLKAGGPGRRPQWVAVLYADWEIAGSPRPEEVLDLARDGFGAVLVDTYRKDGQHDGLFRWLAHEELKRTVVAARDAGLTTVLSGALTLEGALRAASLSPDAVGVRTAVCKNGLREADLNARAVRSLARALRQASRSSATTETTRRGTRVASKPGA